MLYYSWVLLRPCIKVVFVLILGPPHVSTMPTFYFYSLWFNILPPRFPFSNIMFTYYFSVSLYSVRILMIFYRSQESRVQVYLVSTPCCVLFYRYIFSVYKPLSPSLQCILPFWVVSYWSEVQIYFIFWS